MPNIGSLIEVSAELADHFESINVAARYETKVTPPPQETKAEVVPKKSSASLRPAPAQRKPTRKNSKKSATK